MYHELKKVQANNVTRCYFVVEQLVPAVVKVTKSKLDICRRAI